jgi:uncharacterized membrane protein YfcA
MKEKLIVSTCTLAASLASYYYAKHINKDTAPTMLIGAFLGAIVGEIVNGALADKNKGK